MSTRSDNQTTEPERHRVLSDNLSRGEAWCHYTSPENVPSIISNGIIARAEIELTDFSWRAKLENAAWGQPPIYIGKDGSYGTNYVKDQRGENAARIDVDTTGLNLRADLPALEHDYGIRFKENVNGELVGVLSYGISRDQFYDLADNWIISNRQIIDPNSEFTKRAIQLTGTACVLEKISASRVTTQEASKNHTLTEPKVDNIVKDFVYDDIYDRPRDRTEELEIGVNDNGEFLDLTKRELTNLSAGDLRELNRFNMSDQYNVTLEAYRYMVENNLSTISFEIALIENRPDLSEIIPSDHRERHRTLDQKALDLTAPSLEEVQRMSFDEIKAKMQRLEPIPVLYRPGMLESDTTVKTAQAEYDQANKALWEAQYKLSNLVDESRIWTEAHPIRLWLHNNGFFKNEEATRLQDESQALIQQIEEAKPQVEALKTAWSAATSNNQELADKHRADREREMKAIEPMMKVLRQAAHQKTQEKQMISVKNIESDLEI